MAVNDKDKDPSTGDGAGQGSKDPKATSDAKASNAAPKRKVIVLVDNLGPKLYAKGTVTDDPEVAALIDDPRGLVSPVD